MASNARRDALCAEEPLTHEELERYDRVLEQALEEEGFAEEDRPILERVEWLYQEVANEWLRRRLEQLESRTEKSVEDSAWYQRYLWMQRHYFPLIENYHREQHGLEPLPVAKLEEEPDPEFDAFFEHYLDAHEKNDPQMIQENTEWWHRMRWERYGIPGWG